MDQSSSCKETAISIKSAAGEFLNSLQPDNLTVAKFEFASEERWNWHYTPRPRNGLPFQDMSAGEFAAAESLIARSLSVEGLRKAKSIIDHELILGQLETSNGTIRYDRNPGLYFFTIFGDPNNQDPWGWRVDGHHLSLNFTIVGNEVSSVTPSFFGANPAEVKTGSNKGLRILKEEEDTARALFCSLDDIQRTRTLIYANAPADIITRASRTVEISEPKGLPASEMFEHQRGLLMLLINTYLDKKPADVVNRARNQIEKDGVGNIHFAWGGSEYPGQKHYYRIHGPNFFAEYDNTQDMANHIHSVWRDQNRDFGLDLLKEHYSKHHS